MKIGGNNAGDHMTDSRLQELTSWTNDLLDHLLEHKLGLIDLEPVSGDASFRRYFRARVGDESYIAVDAPPEHEDNKTFTNLSNMLIAAGIHAPKAYSVDFERGFMLLVDFGDELYLPALLHYQQTGNLTHAEELYSEAIDSLVLLQAGIDADRLPPFTVEKLTTEMTLFSEWFCGQFLQLTLDTECQTICNNAFAWLAQQISEQPQVAVHRDYHSRNLMLLDESKFGDKGGPGVIDFQDAVSGPYSYDLVSLLRDCYIAWPVAKVHEWASVYRVKAQTAGMLANVSEQQLIRDMDICGMQRHLKVIGIFARLSIRDNKSQYLADIPLVIRYLLDVSERYEEMGDFRAWFIAQVLPQAERKLQLEY